MIPFVLRVKQPPQNPSFLSRAVNQTCICDLNLFFLSFFLHLPLPFSAPVSFKTVKNVLLYVVNYNSAYVFSSLGTAASLDFCSDFWL